MLSWPEVGGWGGGGGGLKVPQPLPLRGPVATISRKMYSQDTLYKNMDPRMKPRKCPEISKGYM